MNGGLALTPLDTLPPIGDNGPEGSKCFMRKRDEGDIIGPVQAAELLGIGRSTLWRASNEGLVPVHAWVPQRSKTGETSYRALYSRTALVALKEKWVEEGRDSRHKHKRPRGESPDTLSD